MSDDVAKLANKLNENMAHAVLHAYKGGINCDIPTATQKALAKRGLATWDSCHGADLTPLGLQVQDHLKAAEQAKMEALAEKCAAERKIRDEGYAAGQSQMLSACAHELYQAVYPGDSWPDRPNDTIFNALVEDVRKYLAGRRVTTTQVELVTRQYYDVIETDYFDDKPPNVQDGYVEVMHNSMINAGISVVSAEGRGAQRPSSSSAQPPSSEASPQ
jgi:hypothetical protein